MSDNSTSRDPGLEILRRKYGFIYIRQSGDLSMVEHWNLCCLRLATTRWVLMLHDDDELYPDAVRQLESFLAGCKDVGIVVGGVQYIDEQGEARKEWVPKSNRSFWAEDGLLRLGLDFGARWPGIILNVPASVQIGGFADIGGYPADYTYAVRLAYSWGVTFFPGLIGRYRYGPQQANDLSTPEKTKAHLEYSMRQGESVRTFGCSESATERIVDYMTWWPFSRLVPRWLAAHSSFVFEMAKKCSQVSPGSGEWQTRVREKYPFLFWRPQWLVRPFFCFLRKSRNLVRRLLGDVLCRQG